jgi:putative ABC transport system ATP-binding protein
VPAGMAMNAREVSALVVRATGVVRTYRQGESRVPALRGISLEIGRGEFAAIMGPSGSGKSTLLHVLGGLDVPEAGSIVIAGHSLQAMSDDELTVFRRRHIGIVFQSFNLVPTLTAEENVALPLRLDGVSIGAARSRTAEALASVGMLPRRCHTPDQLSGGELQRVAVARAIVVEPILILADEPTGSLDSRTAEEILGLLRRAVREQGRTIVMVTHDAGAASYAQRIIRVVDGRVEPQSAGPLQAVPGGLQCAPGGS